ncbi:Thymidylate kinase [Trapelia coarctata]|nr:Thymidylate kinase [Trapelia coarctata]
MVRGALIVIEGLDRAGKSTQCELLCRSLEKEGHRIKRMRFPDRATPSGKLIDAYLKGEAGVEDHVIHLLFSANRWEASAQIRKDIADGITLVIDRYSYSGVVYSVAKDNPSLPLKWAWQMESGLPRPDLCVFLDIEPEKAHERGGYGNERYETWQMQSRVRGLFKELFQLPCAIGAVEVNAGRPIDLVQHNVLNVVRTATSEAELQHPLWSFEPM